MTRIFLLLRRKEKEMKKIISVSFLWLPFLNTRGGEWEKNEQSGRRLCVLQLVDNARLNASSVSSTDVESAHHHWLYSEPIIELSISDRTRINT